jgi:hypothetical protein
LLEAVEGISNGNRFFIAERANGGGGRTAWEALAGGRDQPPVMIVDGAKLAANILERRTVSGAAGL